MRPCLPGWDSDHPHGASGSVHALLATAMRQLPAAVHPAPGRVLGGSPAGPHLPRGQSNTQGPATVLSKDTVFLWIRWARNSHREDDLTSFLTGNLFNCQAVSRFLEFFRNF